jgi:hypothetical protein
MQGSVSVVVAKGIRGSSFDFRRIDRRLHSRDIALRRNQPLGNEGELAHTGKACSLIKSAGISR